MGYYPYIPLELGRKSVMRGLRSQKAQISGELESEIDENIRLAKRLFHVKGRDLALPIEHIDAKSFGIGGSVIVSASLTKLLSGSSSAYLMGTTIEASEVAKINEAMEHGEGLKAIVFDSYASQYVDDALGVLMDRKAEQLRRTGQRLTKFRFSAGYGDLELKYQRVFFDLLEMDTLGVQLSENYLMDPEKSVIAIAGIESLKGTIDR